MSKKWWKDPEKRIIIGKKISDSLKGKKKVIYIKNKIAPVKKEYTLSTKLTYLYRGDEYKNKVEQVAGLCVCCKNETKHIVRLKTIKEIATENPDFVIDDFFVDENIVLCCFDCYKQKRDAIIKELMLLK